MNNEEINKIIGEPTGWHPPKEDYTLPSIEELESQWAAEDKMIADLNATDIHIVEMGKCRGSMYPRCSICDADAFWGVMPKWVSEAKEYSTSSDRGEEADGKSCKTYRSCKKHLLEVVKLCREEK